MPNNTSITQVQREQAALQKSIEDMRAERLALDAQNQALLMLIELEERRAAQLQALIYTAPQKGNGDE